ncbi:lipase [Penicillium cosmopolitanum]|uniref:Lipase n=1 Tax=Penicillium cosmopolitanum TaxID=1131564 RepID=A0A9W9VZD0_9EURO|nr:lipase [Penicillium cosmopolitanum]KAJ5392214.1 lipase [Penicillium cosmopolitanum]
MKGSHLLGLQVGLLVIAGATTAIGQPATTSKTTTTTTTTPLLTTLFNAASNNENNAIISDIAALLQQTYSTTAPSSVESALSALQRQLSNGAPSIEDAAHGITKAGLIPPDIFKPIYPTKAPGDASYSLSEETLRSAIHIPQSFEYGQNNKTPIILVPGTAIPAGTTFTFNFGKLGTSHAVDPVWLNLPSASLSDAQVNAEFVAYAINYISTKSNQPIPILTWSQGGLNTQWALKFWPSTRSKVSDFIAISPDFHGTVIRTLVCPALSLLVCTPSLWQQGYNTSFIRTLRANDGDSAYVPTTIIYSTVDEIVQPQSGPFASALLSDVRGVGVTTAHLQTVCAGRVGGGFYTHEGVLYNPLAWVLALDAIAHDGPADLDRIDRDGVCGQMVAPELDLSDLLGTEALLVVAVLELALYTPHTIAEPPIMDYASS